MLLEAALSMSSPLQAELRCRQAPAMRLSTLGPIRKSKTRFLFGLHAIPAIDG